MLSQYSEHIYGKTALIYRNSFNVKLAWIHTSINQTSVYLSITNAYIQQVSISHTCVHVCGHLAELFCLTLLGSLDVYALPFPTYRKPAKKKRTDEQLDLGMGGCCCSIHDKNS